MQTEDPLPLRFGESRARRGNLFVVSGPSGVGKDTVLAEFLRILPDVLVCVTCSTRAMRAGESQGNPYTFISVAEFRARAEAGLFLEYAHVNGNFYGTPREWVEEQRAAGIDVILKIDVQGGINVRGLVRDAVMVFLAPPTFEELESRLRLRSTETEEQILVRLLDARSELQQIPNYDYLVVNDKVERAAELIEAIVLSRRALIRQDSDDAESSRRHAR